MIELYTWNFSVMILLGVVLGFVIMIASNAFSNMGVDSNRWIGIGLGLIPYFIVASIFVNFKYAILAGVIGGLVGCIGGGYMIGDDGAGNSG